MDQGVRQKIGKYEVISERGRGGMGVVYRARDSFTGQLVALKTTSADGSMTSEILERFYREAQSAGTLQHRNIVTIYDVGEADRRPYIAMEMIEGESLQSIIDLQARLPLAAKLKLVQQVCEGLGYAHQQGVIHGDVKPSNILVSNDGVVKLVDFAIAHLKAHNLAKTGQLLGTIHYASPEQINDGPVDGRSDLWSVAAVIYELIAYRKAFDGSNLAATISKILTSDPEPLSVCCPGVPAELDPIIRKGLAKNPAERYPSLNEMLKDIEPIALRLQRSLISELIVEAKVLRDQGDLNAARQKVRATLILDHTHAEGNRLFSEIQAEIDRQASGPGIQDAASDAIRAQDRPRAEIPSDPDRGRAELEPIVKAARLMEEGRRAMNQREYGEAARAFTAALELNPQDRQAAELKASAIKERDRLRQVREALSAGQKAMREGDSQTAAISLQKVLELDPAHAEGTSLLGRIKNTKATGDRDAKLREGLTQADGLLAEKKFEEAQFALLELQHEYPGADGVAQRLQNLEPQMKLHQLVTEGEQAFLQGEFGEAVRILTEAQQLAPADEHLTELKVRAVQERDRLRQVREAISGGQRALRQGEFEIAEKQIERALQLDPANRQAASLQAQVRVERQGHAQEETLKSGLKQAEELIAANKCDDAQRKLDDLQKNYASAKPLRDLCDTLKRKRADASATPALPAPPPRPQPRSAVLPTPVNEFTKSMELAEELRRSLQNLKSSPRARPTPPPVAPPQPLAPPVGDGSNVTLLRGAVPVKSEVPAKPPETNATIASTPKLTSSITGQKDPPPPLEKSEAKPDDH